MTRKPFLLATVGALVVLLLMWLPASLMATTVKYASNEHVQLIGSQGTIWNGNARVVYSLHAEGQTPKFLELPSRLQWRIAPVWDSGAAFHISTKLDTIVASPIEVQLSYNSVKVKWPTVTTPLLHASFRALNIDASLTIKEQTNWIDLQKDKPLIEATLNEGQMNFSSTQTLLAQHNVKILYEPSGVYWSIENVSNIAPTLKFSGYGQYLRQKGISTKLRHNFLDIEPWPMLAKTMFGSQVTNEFSTGTASIHPLLKTSTTL